MLRKFQGHGCEEKYWGWGIRDQDTTQKLTEEGNIMCKTAGAEQEVNTRGDYSCRGEKCTRKDVARAVSSQNKPMF